ncbi:hypothetical protein LIER_27910 [Lithospermum erythrorhizon]|uniref:Uncharacterized protein n=1 Tax=Lithospermum erythrorhizon TaxID=34254 RepID=A0AAV3RFS3_LITER
MLVIVSLTRKNSLPREYASLSVLGGSSSHFYPLSSRIWGEKGGGYGWLEPIVLVEMLVALKLMEEVVAGALCARRGSLWSSSSSPKTWVILLEVFACFLGGFWVVLRGGQSFFKFEK